MTSPEERVYLVKNRIITLRLCPTSSQRPFRFEKYLWWNYERILDSEPSPCLPLETLQRLTSFVLVLSALATVNSPLAPSLLRPWHYLSLMLFLSQNHLPVLVSKSPCWPTVCSQLLLLLPTLRSSLPRESSFFKFLNSSFHSRTRNMLLRDWAGITNSIIECRIKSIFHQLQTLISGSAGFSTLF